MIGKLLKFASPLAGMIPGVGALTAFLNPTVIAALVIIGAGSYLYGKHEGRSGMRAVCVAAAKMAEAKAASVDREALQEQVSLLEKAIETRDKERQAADLRISEYETRLKNLGNDARCILTADDVGGL